MKMNKFLTIALAGVLSLGCAVGLASCDNGDKSEEKKIVVGVTDYAPMDYQDENGKWVGFDAELAEKTFGDLDYTTVVFQEIKWESKIIELNSGTIDVIWNGMTITEELKTNIQLSDKYLQNQQYAIVKVENKDSYTTQENLKGKNVVVEAGSAADDAVDGKSCNKIPADSQVNAVMEVAAGTADVAIVDYTMAMTLTAEGSDYYGKLVMVDLGFEVEEFAIGFRKADKALCDAVNAKIKEYRASGYMNGLAKKYGIENLLIAE